MALQFDLTKQSERVQFVLTKRNLPEIRASVGITLDVSGSTEDLYTNGTIQRVLEQLIPIGLKFDDNGNLDVYTFSDSDNIAQVEGATATNYQSFVNDQIIDNDNVNKWGGTSYYPVIKRMLEDYGFYGGGNAYNKSLAGVTSQQTSTPVPEPKKKGFFSRLFGTADTSFDHVIKDTLHTNKLQSASASGEAVINYFITDGENDDQHITDELLQQVESAKSNIYFLFIGVGGLPFDFIRKLGDKYSNVGFVNVKDLQKFVDSDDIYDQLLPLELTQWLTAKKV